jgi:hypothetical protein
MNNQFGPVADPFRAWLALPVPKLVRCCLPPTLPNVVLARPGCRC